MEAYHFVYPWKKEYHYFKNYEPPIRCLCVLAPKKQHPYLTLRPCLTKHSWINIVAQHTLKLQLFIPTNQNCIAEILSNKKALRVISGIVGKPNKDARLLQMQIRIDRDLATLSIQVHKGHLYQRWLENPAREVSSHFGKSSISASAKLQTGIQTKPFLTLSAALEPLLLKLLGSNWDYQHVFFNLKIGINGSPLIIRSIHIPIQICHTM